MRQNSVDISANSAALKSSGENNKSKKKEKKGINIPLTIIGIVLCAVLLPILIINLILIIQGFGGDKSKVPNIGGYFPLMVESESMEPTIMTGDLIIVHTVDNADELEVGDIVTYWENQPGGALITHRIAEVTTDSEGKKVYRTKGDGNVIADSRYLYPENVVGTYKSRLAGMGRIAMFMQTIPGLIVCVILPLTLFVVYDIIRRKRIAKANNNETAALLAELEELKRQQAQRELEAESTKTADSDNKDDSTGTAQPERSDDTSSDEKVSEGAENSVSEDEAANENTADKEGQEK